MEVPVAHPRKQSANVSVRSDMLQQAKARHINLSQTLENRLEELLKEQDRQAWLDENRQAMAAANDFVEKNGLWSEKLRQF